MTEIFTLVLPTNDPNLKPRLQGKLKQYNLRKIGEGDAWFGLEDADAHKDHADYRDAFYKHFLLARVLLGAPVNVAQTKAQLSTKYGTSFNGEQFDNAVGVIDSYVTGKLELLQQGTGLPELETATA